MKNLFKISYNALGISLWILTLSNLTFITVMVYKQLAPMFCLILPVICALLTIRILNIIHRKGM